MRMFSIYCSKLRELLESFQNYPNLQSNGHWKPLIDCFWLVEKLLYASEQKNQLKIENVHWPQYSQYYSSHGIKVKQKFNIKITNKKWISIGFLTKFNKKIIKILPKYSKKNLKNENKTAKKIGKAEWEIFWRFLLSVDFHCPVFLILYHLFTCNFNPRRLHNLNAIL